MTKPNTMYSEPREREDIGMFTTGRALPADIRAEIDALLRDVICGGFLDIEKLQAADEAGSLMAAKKAIGVLCADWDNSPLQRAKRLRRKINMLRE